MLFNMVFIAAFWLDLFEVRMQTSLPCEFEVSPPGRETSCHLPLQRLEFVESWSNPIDFSACTNCIQEQSYNMPAFVDVQR
jgi:hypothetical protein